MKSSIQTWSLAHQPVLLRIDANVPISQGIILNDQRLQASVATINMLLDKGAHIILLTHLGRPYDNEPELSTKQLLPWFFRAGYDVIFADNVADAQIALNNGHQIVLYENLRFFSGELTRSISFAQELAQLGNYYVNDAFGTLHRTDCSITVLPEQFDDNHKSIGLLIQHELHMLNNFIRSMRKPFVLCIGGGKVHDKIPLINALLPQLSAVCVGPGICFAFLKALDQPVGKSYVNSNVLALCKEILQKADQLNIPFYYPQDYIVAQHDFEGALDLTTTSVIDSDEVGVSIGPKTVHHWETIITSAHTVLVNGLMGSLERPETLTFVQDLFKHIALTDATSIIAGGDSIAAAYQFDIARKITYLSTGGGVTLQYISGHPLPGLIALKDGTKTQ